VTRSPDERFDLRRLYETMVLIRLFEPEAERQYKKANIGGYCHLSTV
jgi:TPP-dependent pyruvate/acetoin dehydrogenase alpha subunit